MRTKLISTLKKELLIVGAKDEKIAWAIIFQKYGVKAVSDYTLLGKPSEIREEDAEELVEQSIHSGLFAHYVKGIPVNTYCYKTALDSFHSALESVIFWDVNPLGEEEPEIIEGLGSGTLDLAYENKQWYEAQEKTFDKNRTLIFVKN